MRAENNERHLAPIHSPFPSPLARFPVRLVRPFVLGEARIGDAARGKDCSRFGEEVRDEGDAWQ